MKLSLLLAAPSLLVVPVIAERSKSDWVGDLEKVTQDYRKVLTGVKNTSHGPHVHFFSSMHPLEQSRVDLNRAENWQRVALTPHPSRGNIAEEIVCLKSFPMCFQIIIKHFCISPVARVLRLQSTSPRWELPSFDVLPVLETNQYHFRSPPLA